MVLCICIIPLNLSTWGIYVVKHFLFSNSFTESALQLQILLHGSGSVSGLAELEVYVSDDPTSTSQSPYTNSPTAAYIIHQTDQRPVYEFSQVSTVSCLYHPPDRSEACV